MNTTATATTDALKNSRIAILGYGSQGRAHALNLHESGLDVVVGVRKNGPSWAKAQADGLRVAEPADTVKEADLVAVLTPDMVQPALYEQAIAPNLKTNAALLFAHGFNVHFGQIKPRADIDVILVAPKGPGALVRREYEKGHGVPCLFAIEQDASGQARDKVLAYAAGIGGARAMLIETHFAEETERDIDIAAEHCGNSRCAALERHFQELRAGCGLHLVDRVLEEAVGHGRDTDRVRLVFRHLHDVFDRLAFQRTVVHEREA